jgi:hypothetical protein
MSAGGIIKQLGQVRGPATGKVWPFTGTGASVTWTTPAEWFGRQIAIQAHGAEATFLFGLLNTVSVDDAARVTGTPPGLPASPATGCGFIPSGDTAFFVPKAAEDLFFAYKGSASLCLRCWISDNLEVD